MAAFTRLAALAALLASSANLVAGVATSGSGTTTRYCPVKTCDISDKPLSGGVTAQSGCQGGTSFMCSDQSPWAVDDNLAYGFAAVTAANPTCCTCYKLTFTSTSIAGKTMIVQATNTGNDVSGTQFDLAMPGGGFGQFDGCSKEWKATSSVWGAQYGGSNTNQCSAFPAALQKGCGFRWDWMKGQSNPKYALLLSPCTPFTSSEKSVTCPAEIVAKSGCSVSGYVPPSGGSGSGTSTSIAPGSPPATTKTAPTQTPTKKASDTSTFEVVASSSVVDGASSLATGTATGGFVGESGTGTATGVMPTGTGMGGEGEEGATGEEGEGEEEDDTCEL
ncbi:MAG: hypothetical protein Q9222_007479 [Ikaeria aurantiellina]